MVKQPSHFAFQADTEFPVYLEVGVDLCVVIVY
jgi:hypothetical protein